MTLRLNTMDVNTPIFDIGTPLPRGPHNLSREEVRASQASRLGAAIAELVSKCGFPAVSISAIAKRAGVSYATFYEHYHNKEACYLAAYARFGDVLSAQLTDAVPAVPDREEIVDAVLTRYLGMLDANPSAARAFVLEIDGAGPAARAEGRKLYARMATFVRYQHESMQREDPSLGGVPPEAYTALVHGVRGLVRDVLDTESAPRLVRLAPSLRSWISAFIRGASLTF